MGRGAGVVWLIVIGISLVGSVFASLTEDDGSDEPVVVSVPQVTETTLAQVVNADAVRQVYIYDVTPGTCVASIPAAALVVEVPTLPCAEFHQYEVFAIVDVGGPDDYPGFSAVIDLAYEACGTQFFDYVGESYATSDWYVDVITPTEESWNDGDKRTASCLLYLWNTEAEDASYITGSARGSGDATG